ncbi:glutathione s-transferase [Thalassiosira pseudonana CCMP1335]|uniref:Glutathione s-transferase n=1 Tax=Thalassiosira pseudonana TaxID=35128 RepID=B8C933_THAPS|nr:glutathione s-transferase [Thalassiosira pseudonana CCMP1335]EED89782.1 glutathione s-transferase [Thalassiosira pseudonana CCMP1335]
MGADGSFKRKESAWRNWISSEEGSKFKPEANRYHLYVAAACPWAHRTMVTRAVKGLQDVISCTVVMPVWQKTSEDPQDKHCGWSFAKKDDPVFAASNIREIYEKVGDIDGKYTVPILFDKKLNTIVSNESSEIIQMLNSQFNEFASFPDVELEPQDMKEAMEEVNSWIYPSINNGVYRCGFATSQHAYDNAIEELTSAFDRLEDILSKQRFIAGDRFTLADIRLFVTLLRFDEVYVVYFKTNTRSVATSPVLLNYCRELYQMQGVADTVDMHQIKEHYYCSHPDLNKYSVIPKGPGFESMLKLPHNRVELESKKRKLSLESE